MVFFSLAHAQQSVIEFKAREHNFGRINEENGVVSTVFEFTNTGASPLVITGVSTSCGCAAPSWTREPVPPGRTGYVKATYNPDRRPGPFRQTITVRSNASESTIVLIIVGEVIPRPREVQFPVKMGDIRLQSRTPPLFDIVRGRSRSDRMEIRNATDREVAISFANVPSHIILQANPRILSAQQTGSIIITYNAQNIDDFGSRTDHAYVVLNGNRILTDEYRLTINSNLREDFTRLTPEQRANAPVAEFQERQVSIELRRGERRNVTVGLRNTGREPLAIRKVTSSDDRLRITHPETVAPSKTGQIRIEANAANISEDFTARITVITNDPRNPTTTITVRVRIVR